MQAETSDLVIGEGKVGIKRGAGNRTTGLQKQRDEGQKRETRGNGGRTEELQEKHI